MFDKEDRRLLALPQKSSGELAYACDLLHCVEDNMLSWTRVLQRNRVEAAINSWLGWP